MNQAENLLLSLIRLAPAGAPSAEIAASCARLPEREWEQLLRLGAAHGLLPVLYERLKPYGGTGLPDTILPSLHDRYLANAGRNALIAAQLGSLLRLLHDAHIPVIVLKGAYLAERVYPDPALRTMGDIDLLAPEACMDEVDRLLQSCGYHPPLGQDWYNDHHRHFHYSASGKKAGVEVHWSLSNPHGRYRLDLDSLWRHARPVYLSGAPALGLAQEHLLLHLCLHAAADHCFKIGLRPFLDMAYLLAEGPQKFDWASFQDTVIAWGLERPVYLALRLAQELAGVELPPAVLAALRPADYAERLLDWAREQALLGPVVPVRMSEALSQAYASSGWGRKLRLALRQTFLPREQTSTLYPVSSRSWRVYLYYFVGAKDLFWRYRGSIAGLVRRDPDAVHSAGLVSRAEALKTWLAEA